jgi:hypothetical protein
METNCEHVQGPLTVLGTQGRRWGGGSFRLGLSPFLLPDDGTHWTGGFPMARHAGWGRGFFGLRRSSNLTSVTKGY